MVILVSVADWASPDVFRAHYNIVIFIYSFTSKFCGSESANGSSAHLPIKLKKCKSSALGVIHYVINKADMWRRCRCKWLNVLRANSNNYYCHCRRSRFFLHRNEDWTPHCGADEKQLWRQWQVSLSSTSTSRRRTLTNGLLRRDAFQQKISTEKPLNPCSA